MKLKTCVSVLSTLSIIPAACLAADVTGDRNNIGLLHSLGGTYSTISGGVVNTTDGDWNTIGGGSYNLIQGNLSTIGGGNFNWMEAYVSFIGGGNANQMNGGNCLTISGGSINTAAGYGGAIGGGEFNSVSTNFAAIGGGDWNTVTAPYGTIPGGSRAVASHYGQMAFASGQFANVGDAQSSLFVLRQISNSTNKVELFLDGTGQRMTLPVGATWGFEMMVVARSSGGNSSAWTIKGVLENVGGTTAKIGTFTKTALGEDASAWALDITADNTYDCLSVKATGDTSTIRWVASVRTTEVVY